MRHFFGEQRICPMKIILILLIYLPSKLAVSQEIKLEKRNTQQGWSIYISLKNNTQKSIKTYKSNLPWVLDGNLELKMIPLASNFSAIEYVPQIDDARFDPIEIASNETVTGQILVGKKFPDFDSILLYGPIFICYRYSELIVKNKSSTNEGCIIFEKI